jgi:poly-gamma-glutamate capsule biosynthesis protein CapA/YwtB (metallophosphatase superfamily)|tara:strand:+ start:2266 stop:3462 length:1197 start_codon:yes stop_codon:yes gene_type:complete
MECEMSKNLMIAVVAVMTGCGVQPPESELTLVVAGQALIKIDPRLSWENPFGSLKPILDNADVAFTNFEMAVKSEHDRCGLPEDYVVVLGEPSLPRGQRPGNTGGPHAVEPGVMEFLASLGFNLMSISNNHAWDLGDCGVAATRLSAEANDVVYAGGGVDLATATAPAYIEVDGVTVGLIAATTSRDERDLISGTVNGVWTGQQEDIDRNLQAVREAAGHADFVIYYQHFQIDRDDFDDLGHEPVPDLHEWQSDFARMVIDAGASMYVGHGERAFDGLEIYKGKPLIRQLGGLAYQGLQPGIGAYEASRPWEGLLSELTIRNGKVVSMEFIPLDLDEGETYRSDLDDIPFLTRRGLAEIAVQEQAQSILEDFIDLSAKYGTELTIRDGRAVLELEGMR